jgi:hypothetical protein
MKGRVDAVEGFVGNASGNVSPKKNSKELKLDPAVRLEAGATSVS